jgi:hypothetical protein
MYFIWEQQFPTSAGVLAKLTEKFIVISLLSLITCHIHTNTLARARHHVLEESQYLPYLRRDISLLLLLLLLLLLFSLALQPSASYGLLVHAVS